MFPQNLDRADGRPVYGFAAPEDYGLGNRRRVTAVVVGPGADAAAELAPTVNRLREIFNDLGPIM
jgi:hypothetical protein